MDESSRYIYEGASMTCTIVLTVVGLLAGTQKKYTVGVIILNELNYLNFALFMLAECTLTSNCKSCLMYEKLDTILNQVQ